MTPEAEVVEISCNIMASYKKPWNNHVPGEGCWCRPIHGNGFLIHRNYEWRDGTWCPMKEPG